MYSKEEKRQSVVPNDKKVVIGEAVEDEEAEYEKEKAGTGTVTSQVSITAGRKASNLEKEVVLRRIRQRRRMNKVRSAFQAFLSSPFSSSKTEEQPQCKRWLDDPFAAL